MNPFIFIPYFFLKFVLKENLSIYNYIKTIYLIIPNQNLNINRQFLLFISQKITKLCILSHSFINPRQTILTNILQKSKQLRKQFIFSLYFTFVLMKLRKYYWFQIIVFVGHYPLIYQQFTISTLIPINEDLLQTSNTQKPCLQYLGCRYIKPSQESLDLSPQVLYFTAEKFLNNIKQPKNNEIQENKSPIGVQVYF